MKTSEKKVLLPVITKILDKWNKIQGTDYKVEVNEHKEAHEFLRWDFYIDVNILHGILATDLAGVFNALDASWNIVAVDGKVRVNVF